MTSLTSREPTPKFGADMDLPPGNETTVYPYDSSEYSAHIDPYTGVMNYQTLQMTRERAVYDRNTLGYAPIASSGTGVVFPDSVRAKVETESTLRVRPTTFRGPKQLDVAEEDGDVHLNRQFHPLGTNVAFNKNLPPWFKQRADSNFAGYPNPDLFYFYTDSIPTHNIQNLTHAELSAALRATGGNYDHEDYMKRIGALLQSRAHDGAQHLSKEEIVVTGDGGGINSDPRLIEQMEAEYEAAFQKARRLQVADATYDPRFDPSAPGVQMTAEQQRFREEQESQFSRVSRFTGFGSSYTQPYQLNA